MASWTCKERATTQCPAPRFTIPEITFGNRSISGDVDVPTPGQSGFDVERFSASLPLMSSNTNLLQLKDVSKVYDSGEGVKLQVLQTISFDLSAGDTAAIVGPSGSGKSTLLNIIGTLDSPTSGQVLLDGQDLARLNDVQTAVVRSTKIGFIFQAHHLLPQCNVLENVLVPTIADKSLRKGAEERAKKLLERVGLRDRITHRPGQLSGGERQRVAVVRALINQPSLLLADEPTGALDRKSADELVQLLLELNAEQKVTLIVVTHAPDIAAKMQKRFELRDGRIV